MARAARRSRRQATRPGLLILALTGCAAMQEPPGGPPDVDPPLLVSVQPDSGAVLDGLRGPAIFQFNEVITELPTQQLERQVLVSPRPRRVKVEWRRSALAVEPEGGWRSGVAYRVSLQPGLTDLRNNRLKEGIVVVFSTGGPIPPGRITGTVIDWAEGRIAVGALVEALRLPDSLAYVAVTDSAGKFEIDALGPGIYRLAGIIDANGNQRREPRESFDSTIVELDTAFSQVIWAFPHDTVGPRIRTVARVDSITIRIEFTQRLAPQEPDSASVDVLLLPDSVPVRVAGVYQAATWDSLEAARAAARGDSVAAADTIRGQRPGRPPARTDSLTPGGLRGRGAGAGPDSAQAALLRIRPRLSDQWVARTATPLAAGSRYVVRARAANVLRVSAQSHTVLVIPAERRDSTARRDTTGRSDSAAVRRDSTGRRGGG